MAKAENYRRKLIELFFFIAVMACMVLALMEIGSNIAAEMEDQGKIAPTMTIPNSSK